MNITQLRAFVTVVDLGSFSDAARAMNVSQPAVTMQVQSLEQAVGATLLDRRYRRVDLTEAGRTLLPHARGVLEQLEQARNEIESLSGTITGRLTIAASTTPGVYVVPKMLGAFLDAYPEIGLSVAVHDTAEVVEAVENGSAHLGIAGSTLRGARVMFEELARDELVLISAPSNPIASRKRVALADLFDERWVLRESGSGTRLVAEKILAEQGLDPGELRVAVELGTGEAIVSAVEGGLGLAIVSRFVAEKAIELGTVVQVDAVGLPTTRPFYTVLPKGTPTRAAQAFLQHLQTALG